MKKLFFILALAVLLPVFDASAGQYRRPVKPTRNLIVMIPDGTAMSVVSAARWYQIYNKQGPDQLAVDPYLCGTVKTFSSNAPIGDSAPTTSCYMTGMPQQVGNVAIYPVADPENDLVPVDSSKTYQPLVTLLEAVKVQQGKATGMVFTCEFPHATPADCSSHYYDRSAYECIAPQIVGNNLDVVFGGGVSIINDDMKKHFKSNGTTLLLNDLDGFRKIREPQKVWALFGEKTMAFDLDRDEKKEPSLAEMTRKAINILSQNRNGFFLMVEGSKVDFAAHANDAVGCITEYLAFDRAVKEAIEFAKKDGNTTVVIMPDHANSGFSIGNGRSTSGYNRKTIHELFKDVSGYKKTCQGLRDILVVTKPDDMAKTVTEYTGLELKDKELKSLLQSNDYKMGNEGKNGRALYENLREIMNSRTYFGFTTGGHTGEDVFLAVFHPTGNLPFGMNTNMDIHHYMYDVTGLTAGLDQLTSQLYAKHGEVFQAME